jgi:hypothetical protein
VSPSSVEAIAPGADTRSLAAKIECAILSVLVHCHGQFEGTLENWFRSLKLAFPEIERTAQVRDVFKQLCEEGVIGLNSPWIGDYRPSSQDEDFHFLALDQFTASLTSRGAVRWDAIRR